MKLTSAGGLPGIALDLLSTLYGFGQRVDRAFSQRRRRRLAVPVVSIGNVTVGGTGKTPTTIAICRALIDAGHRPAILSRGYGATSGGANDEAAVIRAALPNVPQGHGKHRYESGRRLLASDASIDVFVLDDGFQHYQLDRDVDLVVVDATRPFGFGRLLPRGLLREPLSALDRASGFVLTRMEHVSVHTAAIIEAYFEQFHAGKPLWRARSEHGGPRRLAADESAGGAESSWVGMQAYGFCGLGNPRAFEQDLVALGVELTGFRAFSDHYHYTAKDLQEIVAAARGADALDCVCTEKDAVKLEPLLREQPVSSECRFWSVPLEFGLSGPALSVLGSPFS